MHRIVLAGLLVLTLSWAATAQPARKELRGYSSLLFGMTEQEARQVQPFAKQETEQLGLRLTAGDKVALDDLTFELSVLLQQGRIGSILLASTNDETSAACTARLNRAMASVRKRYGAPDRAPRKEDIGPAKSIISDFTFKDGNRIGVTYVFLGPSLCFVNIGFFQKGAGAPF